MTGLLIACNSNNADQKNKAKAEQEEHQGHGLALTLNNGAKWKADSATKANVLLFEAAAQNAKKDKLEDYHQTADQLQNALNKMIAECKMQGADHDALHKWLEPLIEKIKKLKGETTTEKAQIDLKEIEEHIHLFNEYFE